MCGINGIVYYDKSRLVSKELIQRMNHVLRHRGPDDQGVWVKNNVGLGQARLSIIDLSPLGHQPMCNEDGSVWITFNGEIYNFPELKEFLQQKGHIFRSQTDTETVIHLWEEFGANCVQKLRGMFAFALWDERQQTLFMARDRMGKKPLFYAALPNRFIFASEIKAILQDEEFEVEPDLEAIHHYLTYQSVPAPYSAFKGIRKLPPAHSLLLKNGECKLERFWFLSYQQKLKVKGEAAEKALQEEIIERLREAVRIRLMSDVPLGAFLSGGIDSSIVVALMAGLLNQPVKTFSIGFEEDEYNELPFARLVAQRYHTDHHEFIVKPDAQAIFPQLVWHYNEPFADSSAIPTYYVSKLAREYVTVVLTGDGGDENYAGYPRYANLEQQLLSRLVALKRWLQGKQPTLDEKRQLFTRSSLCTPQDRQRLRDLTPQRLNYYHRITHFSEAFQRYLYAPAFFEKIGNTFAVDVMLEKYRQADAKDFLDSTLYVDLHLYLPDTLMTKTDIAGMTHSLEARMPFLDHPFLEFTASIPSALKLKHGKISKYILKKAVEPYLPHEVIYRQKMGFGVPTDHWFRNELKEMTYDILLSKRAIERGYFKVEYIRDMLQRHQNGENWQYHIWNLLMLEMWHLMFVDKILPFPITG